MRVTHATRFSCERADAFHQVLTRVRCDAPLTCRFDGLSSFNVEYERKEWLGNGDRCCRMLVRQTAK
jgi:hypothetical protein